jgi:hypothetical protein
MSLADKRARADQLRGELSQLRVEREAALQENSATSAETQIDAELERLEAERQQALLDLMVVKNGGSVEDAVAAMNAAAELEKENSPNETESTDSEVVESVDSDVPTETPEEATPLLAPGIVGVDDQDGGNK